MKVYTEYADADDMFYKDIHFQPWAGAVPRWNEIVKAGKEEEFFSLCEEIFGDEPISETTLNDFLWFDDDYIFEALEIKE